MHILQYSLSQVGGAQQPGSSLPGQAGAGLPAGGQDPLLPGGGAPVLLEQWPGKTPYCMEEVQFCWNNGLVRPVEYIELFLGKVLGRYFGILTGGVLVGFSSGL